MHQHARAAGIAKMPKRVIKVFIASPGDLPAERRTFKETIEELNPGFGDDASVEFLPLGWEDTLARTGRRPQSVINADVDACDVFVLALYRRWGQEAPDSEFSSYTEEEFHRALIRWQGTRAPEIFIFFKTVDADSIADPGPQLTRVLAFRREIEESRAVIHRPFADAAAFACEVHMHLRAFAKGELQRIAEEPTKVILPIQHVERVMRAEREASERAALAEELGKRASAADDRANAAIARAEVLGLSVARLAAEAAANGRLEQARQLFAQSVAGRGCPARC